ncbi:hypothetical protein A2U01_0051972, partial [Trifolium medium]|nr:hypothetical protein [Trifolium medium]
MQRTSDYYHACKSSRTVTMTPKAVRWIGWVEVNTNGASKDEGIEAVVGLLIIDEVFKRQRPVSLNSRSTNGSHSQGIAMERGV